MFKGTTRPDIAPTKFVNAAQAPGYYTTGKESSFGNANKRSFSIGQKRDIKIEKTAGPGQYDTDAGLKMTKARVPSPVLGKTSRPNNFSPVKRNINNNESNKPVSSTFDKVITYPIGIRPKEIIPYGPGPGDYEPQRSESVAKCRNPTIKMDSGPARPDNFSPSKYRTNNNESSKPVSSTFDKVITYSIGKKTKEIVPYGPGPGDYKPSESAIKCRNPTIRMDSGKTRPDNWTKPSAYVETGKYVVP